MQVNHFNFNASLSLLMGNLGYPEVGSGGVCEGLTRMAIQAFFTPPKPHAFRLFLNRIKFLSQQLKTNGVAEITAQLLAEKEKMARQSVPAQMSIDVFALLDGIQLHFSPELYPDLFQESVTQGNDKIFAFTKPLNMEEMPPISKTISWCNIYDLEEFKSYINHFKALADQSHQPLAFDLGTDAHLIALFFEPETQSWTLFDSNRLWDTSLFDMQFDADKFATELFASFGKGKVDVTPPDYSEAVEEKSENQKQQQASPSEIEVDSASIWGDEIALVINNYQSCKIEEKVFLRNVINQNNLLPSPEEVIQKSDLVTESGVNIAYLAIQNGLLDTVKILIEAETDFNQSMPREGFVAIAALNNHPLIIAALNNSNADFNFQDENGMTAAHWAAKYNYDQCLVALKEKSDLESPNTDGDTPLHIAITNSALAAVRMLVENGVEMNSPNRAGYTPLELAVVSGDTQICSFLLEHSKLGIPEYINLFKLAQRHDRTKVQSLLAVQAVNLNKGDPINWENTSLFGHKNKNDRRMKKTKHPSSNHTDTPYKRTDNNPKK